MVEEVHVKQVVTDKQLKVLLKKYFTKRNKFDNKLSECLKLTMRLLKSLKIILISFLVLFFLLGMALSADLAVIYDINHAIIYTMLMFLYAKIIYHMQMSLIVKARHGKEVDIKFKKDMFIVNFQEYETVIEYDYSVISKYICIGNNVVLYNSRGCAFYIFPMTDLNQEEKDFVFNALDQNTIKKVGNHGDC